MAIQATSEEQLRLKKRARQRLLGAGALLLTAAIVLPMVLDQSPRQPNQDVVIDMGSATPSAPAAPGRPTPIQDEQPVIAAPAELAKSNADPAEPETATRPPIPLAESKSHADIVAPQINAASAVAAKSVDRDVPKVVARSEPKAEVKVEPKAEKPAVKPAPQPTLKAEPKAESKAKAVTLVHDEKHDEKLVSTQHFVVQLGAFSNAENVQQLRDRLSAAGVSTYTEKLPSGATRVRVGPYADKAQAVQALAKVNATGVQAQVVPLK